MHTYIFQDQVYSVGFFDPRGTPALPDHAMWHTVAEYATEQEARDLVNYLNGGPGPLR
jgi:hypothetical protein